MELKQLQFLVVCAETQSFSKASALLYTSQSNVSKVIKSLEDELGVELFERRQSGIVLTVKGRQIYDYASSTLENANRIMEFSKQEEQNGLKISSNPSSWMAAAFCDYYREVCDRNLKYSVKMSGTNDLIDRLTNNIDQLGFVYVMEEQLSVFESRLTRNHLNFTVLAKTTARLYLNQNVDQSILSEDESEKLTAERKIPLIQGFDDENLLKHFWNDDKSIQGDLPGYRVAVTTNSDYIMQELLQTTNLGNVSGGYLNGKEERFGLHQISLSDEERPVLFGCIFRNDKDMDKSAVQFLTYIRKRLK